MFNNEPQKSSKIVLLLSMAQMWDFFSHYGVRALLVLYMVDHLHFSDVHAFGVNAVFNGLVELGAIFGGMIADKYLGLKKAVLLGGILSSVGYFSLFFEKSLFGSLGIIIAGASLFSSNIAALLGLSYAENDPNRKKGFTLFYMLQNLGTLFSTFLCGWVATHYGFRLGFLLASSGMVVGNFILFRSRNKLPSAEEPVIKKPKQLFISSLLCLLIVVLGTICLSSEKFISQLLPWITGSVLLFFVLKLLKDPRWEKKQVITLLLYLMAIILFFAAEDQISSSLLLFAQRSTNRTFFSGTIPSSIIMCINPIVILMLGTLIAKRTTKIITPFLLSAASFGVLTLICLLHISLSIFSVMGIVAIVSIAELMIGPLVLSKASEIAGKGSPGMVMGIVQIAFSLAFQMSGVLSKLVAIDRDTVSFAVYGKGFGLIALIMLVGGMFMHLLMKRFLGKKNLIPAPIDIV